MLACERVLHVERGKVKWSDTYWLYAIGRVVPGTNLRQVEAHVTAEVQRWYADEGNLLGDQKSEIGNVRVPLPSVATGIGSLERSYGPGLQLMMIFSGLVLLISCANV